MNVKERLTPKQYEVAEGVARGCSNREIARQLGMSRATVGNYVSHIYNRLGVRGRVRLVALMEADGGVK